MNRAEYREYVAAFKRGTEGLETISSGACPGCKDCGLAEGCSYKERELAGEPFFSWRHCEFCGRPEGGDREHAHAIIDGELCHFEICTDCVYFLNYGRLDDSTMLEIEKEEDAAVSAAATLSGAALLDAARNGTELNQCDED